MTDSPFMLYDMDRRELSTVHRARLVIEKVPGGRIAVGCWENATTAARGASVDIDYRQLNVLHEHLGRLLLASGVPSRIVTPDAPAYDALRQAKALLRKAFEATRKPNPPERLETAIKIAHWLFENDHPSTP